LAQPFQFRYQSSLDDLKSNDKHRQDHAFASLSGATKEKVDWAYEVWDDLLRTLAEGNNRQRAIAAQVLCDLAKSDAEKRMVEDVSALLEVTKDERFVTARHCLQSLWKVGVAGERQRDALVKGLINRFKECSTEKNCTLIRYDIQVVLRRLFDIVNDAKVRTTAENLMSLEPDQKYKKKYESVWRNLKEH
jgi:hypothetical protein